VRIISGEHKGIQLNPPAKLPVRPTTDRAKEALFNILETYFDLESCKTLDLFAGTGNISFEFCSRGVQSAVAVDLDFGCVSYIKEIREKLKYEQLQVAKSNVFSWLKSSTGAFDLIFADPPYDLPTQVQLPALVFEKELLAAKGWLIIEHSVKVKIPHERMFDERNYGQSVFSFYK
jgi:16S rRNA (guanine966-N2)-methyltransferase